MRITSALIPAVAAMLLASLVLAQGSSTPADTSLLPEKDARALVFAQRAGFAPQARKDDTRETLHGIVVADQYRWMEDLNSSELRGWTDRQNDRLQRFARSLSGVESYRQRIMTIQNFRAFWPPERRKDRFVVMETENAGGGSTANIKFFTRKEGDPDWKVLITDDRLTPVGKYRLHRFYSVSPDGRYLVFTYSLPASRWRRLGIMEIESTAVLSETLVGLHTISPTIAWMPDSSGFYYVRFQAPVEADEITTKVPEGKIFFHQIGSDQKSDALIYENPTDSTWLYSPAVVNGKYLLLAANRGTANHNSILIGRAAGTRTDFTNLVEDQRGIFTYLGHLQDRAFFLSDESAPRGKIVAISVSHGFSRQTVVPETKDTIVHANFVGSHFVIAYTRDALPRVVTFRSDGTGRREIQLDVGNIWGPPWGPGFTGTSTEPFAYFSLSNLADPSSIYQLELDTGEVRLWARPKLSFAPSDFETRQVFFKSKDGTDVPMFLVYKKGLKQTGSNPTYMYGYGALNWSAFPWFQPHMVAFLERGGLFALPGIRGGGEYGEAWHQAGIKLNRRNAIDDYVSAARWLITSRFTSPRHLMANSSSLSGALGALAVQENPELFAGMIVDFPVLDLLRYHHHTGGQSWIGELGTVEDPDEFRSLLRSSPYHNIKPGNCYKPTLVMAGSKDQVAVPSHAYKYVARLQEAQGCSNPVFLLRVEGAGHGFGATAAQAAQTWALELAFLEHVVGTNATVSAKRQ